MKSYHPRRVSLYHVGPSSISRRHIAETLAHSSESELRRGMERDIRIMRPKFNYLTLPRYRRARPFLRNRLACDLRSILFARFRLAFSDGDDDGGGGGGGADAATATAMTTVLVCTAVTAGSGYPLKAAQSAATHKPVSWLSDSSHFPSRRIARRTCTERTINGGYPGSIPRDRRSAARADCKPVPMPSTAPKGLLYRF
ncbi:hypothetical protein PUN28_000781 [Cardiocondyla obscurior]|uniref:Uncharacterized protein n=1 Tax=Cardiocondyla obscurior TaxID=286306 RepID=A0AAW2H159_9HYME